MNRKVIVAISFLLRLHLAVMFVAAAILCYSQATRAADRTRPTVSVTAPAAGSTLSGNVTLSATATDNVGIAGVQFYVDGTTPLGAEDLSKPYSITVDTRQLANGTHTLMATARDAAGNRRSSAPLTVTVANAAAAPPPPPAPTTQPYSGSPAAVPGTIEAENFDKGGEGVAYHDNVAGNAGGQYRTAEAVDIIASTDTLGGGYVVNNFETGEWLNYTISVPAAGSYDIDLRAATAMDGASYRLLLDGQDVSGVVAVANTGGWSTFQWVGKKTVQLPAGVHVLRLVSTQQYFNLNSLRIAATPAPAPLARQPYGGAAIVLPGTFQAEDFDKGGEGVGYHDNTAPNAGGQYRAAEGVDIVADGTGFVVNNFETGEWLSYSVNVPAAGTYDIGLLASNFLSTASAFHVEVDGVNVTGKVLVPMTASWSTYQWVTKTGIALTAGTHVLKVVSDQQYFNLDAIRVTASAPPAPPPASALWSCTFPNAPSDCGFSEQAKVAGRASVVATGRDGGTGVRLHTEPGDSDVAGSGTSERNDLALSQAATDCYQGKEVWYGHSIYFPSDYVQVPNPGAGQWNWSVVFDFHNTTSGAWQANFHIDVMPEMYGGMRFRGYGGVNSGDGEFLAPIGPVMKNVWYDFVYHIKWSSGSDGYIDAWVNGVRKLAHRGPTLYQGQGCYMKLANYHTPFGQASSVIHDRVLRGTSAAAVSLTPLEGLP